MVVPGLEGCLLPVLGALKANPFADGCGCVQDTVEPSQCLLLSPGRKSNAMHPCHPGQLHRKRNEIISQPLPLRVAFLFSFQTTYCPRSPANSREQTDNAAAINKAALLHIHINQTSNSTIFFSRREGSASLGRWGKLSGGMVLEMPFTSTGRTCSPHVSSLRDSCTEPGLGSSSTSPSAFLLPGSAELKGGIPKAAPGSPELCHCGETRVV